jgi:hypothetical protein
MAIKYGDVVYNPNGGVISKLQNDNTYSGWSTIDYMGDFNFDWESDEDEIMSAGMIVEQLTIPKRATGTITDAALNWTALTLMTPFTSPSEMGTTPNRSEELYIETGGAGLGYFGLVVRYEATSGAGLLAGFPKAMLRSIPPFQAAQNKFRTGEVGIKMVAPSQIIRRCAVLRRFETAQQVPQTAGAFDTFFAGMFD